MSVPASREKTSEVLSGSAPARQFWELWQRNQSPNLTAFAEQFSNLAPNQLAAVICVDLRERWRRKERARAEDYLLRFPEVRDDRESALDVVYCEFLVRDELGDKPGKAEFADRFPLLSIDLGRQIDMHRLLEDQSEDGKNTLVPTNGAVVSDPATLPTLPGFEILGRLGRGGMGVVYKAWQERLYRIVAVKMLQAGELADSEALARFRTEGEAIARLQHPNIVQVYEVGEHDGRPFLVMEYAEAGNLAQRLAGGTPWPANAAAELVETLARAIHYAHQRGVVHRDLTPGNVLMFAEGVPKLSDFGLAKLLIGGQALTRTGDVVGTPSYMSPEQASGTSHALGPATDIYALGAILYEMIAGRPPFRAATALETLAQVMHSDPAPPRQLQPNVPRDLETICLKCLRKEPTRRYPTALALADDLRHFLKDEPIAARPVGQLERVWRWGRREPGWAAAVLLVIVIAIGGVVTATLLGEGLARSRREHERTKAAKLEAVNKLYRATVNEAKAKRLSGRPGQRTLSMSLLKEAQLLAQELELPEADLHELRNEVVACLALPDLQLLREWTGFADGSFGLDFDEDLTMCARGDSKGDIAVRRLDQDKQIGIFSTGKSEPILVRFGPDARSLAAFSGSHLFLWRFHPLWLLQTGEDLTGKLVLDMPVGKGEASRARFAFGVDGDQIAVLHGDGLTISVHETKTGAELYRGQPGEKIARLAFHPHREVLALAVGTDVLLFDWTSKAVVAKVAHPDRLSSLAWGQDGRLLATACDDKLLRVWQMAEPRFGRGTIKDKGPIKFSPKLVARLLSPTPAVELALNRGGSVLGSTNAYGTLRLWDVRGGQQLVMPLSEAGRFRFSSREGPKDLFGRDDRLAVTAPGGKVLAYQIILGREFRRLPSYQRYPQASGRSVVFHPSGRMLIGSGNDGLSVFHMRSGLATVTSLGRWAVPIGFDAKGKLITESEVGYERWFSVLEQPNAFRLGEAKLLAPAGNAMHAELGGKGTILAIPAKDHGARLVFLDDAKEGKQREMLLGPQPDVRYCAVSPDGRFAATGTYDAPGQPGAIIWDTATGERVQDIPAVPRFCDVGFSPDGRWLITAGGGCRLWEAGTWKEGPVLGGVAFAFSDNGLWLAVEGDEGQVRLLDPANGNEYARLTAHGELHSMPCCFSPDGSQLVVFGTESQALHVWDLRAVRGRLRLMQLDWDGPAYPDVGPGGPGRLELRRK